MSGTPIDTPAGIHYFRLASLKGMLALEQVGLKTRGGALRPRIAAELGLKPRDSYDVYIREIVRRMKETKPTEQEGA